VKAKARGKVREKANVISLTLPASQCSQWVNPVLLHYHVVVRAKAKGRMSVKIGSTRDVLLISVMALAQDVVHQQVLAPAVIFNVFQDPVIINAALAVEKVRAKEKKNRYVGPIHV